MKYTEIQPGGKRTEGSEAREILRFIKGCYIIVYWQFISVLNIYLQHVFRQLFRLQEFTPALT